jgi:chromatin segregation and condensation protein Rec8/ScpA/Scc1 (kleisin family)
MDETREGTAAQPATDEPASATEQSEQAHQVEQPPAEQKPGSINVTGSSPEIVSDHLTDDLKIVMGEFDGPLDLLLHLIRQEQVKYKAAAQMLWSRATVERAVFKRAEIETDKNNPEVAVGLFDLLKVFQEILARHKEEVMMEIEREEVSMTEMLERLRNMVMSSGELNLRVFFERARSRRELVVAFLSVLELVRTSEVMLIQKETFGDIVARIAS